MNVEALTTGEALEQVRGEWSALWAQASATPFQTPEWLIPWWQHVAEGELLTLAVREGGRLVGLVPLYVRTRPDGVRELFLLGVATTDQLDGVFAPGLERRAAAAALAQLDRLRDRWDVADFQQLGPGSALLDAELPDGWTSRLDPGEPCYALALTEAGPRAALPSSIRKNLRHYRRKAERVGRVSYARADEQSIDGLSGRFFDLLRGKWGAEAPGQRVQAAHRAAMPGLLAQGSLRLDVLALDERPVAALFAVADREARYLYLMTYDPEYEALSPGTLIIGHAVEEAAREGAKRVDFLRGDEPYKRLWGVSARPLYRRRLRSGR